jgi:cytochrome c oxidase subunit III
MASQTSRYFVPDPSHWPIFGSFALLLMALGVTMWINGMSGVGMATLGVGFALLVIMLFGWFGTVIRESEGGKYNKQVDLAFRWSMSWFIFSEVMFFAAFFGALFYMRVYSVPWLGDIEHKLLWPDYTADWPTAGPGVKDPFTPMEAWGIPAINTIILLTSGVTVTWAHWALKMEKRGQLNLGLFLTVALGFLFLFLQIEEYGEAYSDLNLKLSTGAYGATFFLLTGFHGFHVTLGAIMLTVILGRCLAGHFKPEHHFAFEAAAWYWHFVDVVWLGLFIFVYWLV